METLTTGRIAKICKVDRGTVKAWCEEKGLPYTTTGGRGVKQIKPEDLILFLKNVDRPVPKALHEMVERNKEARKVSILIVDGNIKLIRFFEDNLLPDKFSFSHVPDGESGLDEIKKIKPQIIIVALTLAGIARESIWTTKLKSRSKFPFTMYGLTRHEKPADTGDFDAIYQTNEIKVLLEKLNQLANARS